MKGDWLARVILVTVRGRTKVSSRTDGKRQWRKERNIQRQDKQEIRGEFWTRDDISRTITGTLMIRHKQEREGRPLPRTERSLHHKERAGGCSIRTDGPSLAIVPPSIVRLSTGPAARPHSCNPCPLYEQPAKQTNRDHLSIWGNSCFCR